MAKYHVSYLPEEIIVDILLRLPAKSLLKLRCVSKSWLFWISSYDFAKAHVKNSGKNDDKLMFCCTGFPMDMYTCSAQSALDDSSFIYPASNQNLLVQRVSVDCPWYEEPDVIRFEGSCNGLICLSSYCETLSLWNPTTRKARKLPNSGTVLDFESCGIGYGFGYDELHDDYKVVEYLSFKRAEPTLDISQLKVYSLRANSWKILPNWPAAGRAFGRHGKFFNGAIYWSVYNSDGPLEWVIVSHHLSTDTFSVIHLPDHLMNDDVNVEVKVLRGCLAVCCERNSHMDIWLMKGSWSKVATIPFFLHIRDYEFIRPRPLLLSDDGRMLVNYGTNLSLYDPKDPHTHHFGHILYVETIAYCESLVSPYLEDA